MNIKNLIIVNFIDLDLFKKCLFCNYKLLNNKKTQHFYICNDDLKFFLSELKTSIIKLKNAKILITGGTG